jgi:hypothetical protein
MRERALVKHRIAIVFDSAAACLRKNFSRHAALVQEKLLANL